jgi:fatty acid-binding protein DegV
MNDFILSCCSTADLTQEHFESRNIHYICFHYFLDGKQYADDLGKSMPFDQFYQAMVDGADTKTSQINTDEFIEYFTHFYYLIAYYLLKG